MNKRDRDTLRTIISQLNKTMGWTIMSKERVRIEAADTVDTLAAKAADICVSGAVHDKLNDDLSSLPDELRDFIEELCAGNDAEAEEPQAPAKDDDGGISVEDLPDLVKELTLEKLVEFMEENEIAHLIDHDEDDEETLRAKVLDYYGCSETAEEPNDAIGVGDSVKWMYRGKPITGTVVEVLDNQDVRVRPDEPGRKITLVPNGQYLKTEESEIPVDELPDPAPVEEVEDPVEVSTDELADKDAEDIEAWKEDGFDEDVVEEDTVEDAVDARGITIVTKSGSNFYPIEDIISFSFTAPCACDVQVAKVDKKQVKPTLAPRGGVSTGELVHLDQEAFAKAVRAGNLTRREDRIEFIRLHGIPVKGGDADKLSDKALACAMMKWNKERK